MSLICGTVLVVVVGVTLYAVCGAIFRCGCTMASGAGHCNVHRPGVPHCPWCSAGAWVVGANFVPIIGVTVAGAYAGLRWRRRAWAGVVIGLAGYVVSAAVAGFITARAIGYPMWFGWRL